MSVQELELVAAFLDVGHGDCAIIRFREEHQVRTIVVDGGGPARSGELLSYLLRSMITEIDLLVATHADRDHIAGLLPVVESERVTVHNFWGPGSPSTKPSVPGLRLADERAYQRLYSRVCQRLRAENILCPTRGIPAPGLFSEATVVVLHPPAPNLLVPLGKDASPRKAEEFAARQDEQAMVLFVEAHGIRILLGSDAKGGFWGEAAASADLRRFLDVNIFKVPDYGRSPGFLPAARVLRTEYAVFSLGAEEDKEPSAEVLRACRAMKAEVLCTEHSPEASFCANRHCHAANGGQNIVFCRRRGDASYSTSAYFCPPRVA